MPTDPKPAPKPPEGPIEECIETADAVRFFDHEKAASARAELAALRAKPETKTPDDCVNLRWFIGHAISYGDIAGNLADKIQAELTALSAKAEANEVDAKKWREGAKALRVWRKTIDGLLLMEAPRMARNKAKVVFLREAAKRIDLILEDKPKGSDDGKVSRKTISD